MLFALPGGFTYSPTSRGSETTPVGIFDLAEPPSEGEEEDFYRRFLRGWQSYFNSRFQTYGRTVHFFIHFAPSGGVEARRSQAVEAYESVRPFAVVAAFNTAGGSIPYLEVMHRRGAVAFGNNRYRPLETFRRYSPLAWNHLPSSEEQAASFASFVCRKVAPHPVSFSGNPGEMGRQRIYGLLWHDVTAFPGIRQFKSEVVRRVTACGVRFSAEEVSKFHNAVGPLWTHGDPAMARFKDAGVTTIIRAGGVDGVYSNAAGSSTIARSGSFRATPGTMRPRPVGHFRTRVFGSTRGSSVLSQGSATTAYPIRAEMHMPKRGRRRRAKTSIEPAPSTTASTRCSPASK